MSEISYRDWTLDVYQSLHTGQWLCDYWYTGRPGTWTAGPFQRRTQAIATAHSRIDELIERRGRGEEVFKLARLEVVRKGEGT